MPTVSDGAPNEDQRKVSRLFVPQGGLVYVSNLSFDARELRTWQSFESGGRRITAVPVDHVGGRYGIDSKWMTKSFAGYVVEYHGMSVFFAGDTAYDDARVFRRTGDSFPHLDVALLAIAPIRPSDRMRRVHMEPDSALDALSDLRAAKMIPVHFDTLRSDDAARRSPRETPRSSARTSSTVASTYYAWASGRSSSRSDGHARAMGPRSWTTATARAVGSPLLRGGALRPTSYERADRPHRDLAVMLVTRVRRSSTARAQRAACTDCGGARVPSHLFASGTLRATRVVAR